MIKLINQTRRENGLSDLTISPVLCKAASIRVKEGSQLLSHTLPDGTHYSTVLNTAGLDTSVTKEILVWENLAYKTGRGSFSSAFAMSGLLNSPTHKENILKAQHSYVGIAKYSDSNITCWIQLFA